MHQKSDKIAKIFCLIKALPPCPVKGTLGGNLDTRPTCTTLPLYQIPMPDFPFSTFMLFSDMHVL